MVNGDEDAEAAERPGRATAVALVLGAVLVGGYFATGMPGMGHGASTADGASMSSMDEGAMPPFTRLAPDDFASHLAEPSAVVVNVHTPYDGEIEGTDLFIPYQRIVGDSRLPDDRDAEIALYCRSGRMSERAAEALVDAGFSSVVDLAGGMDAWQADERPVVTDPAGSLRSW